MVANLPRYGSPPPPIAFQPLIRNDPVLTYTRFDHSIDNTGATISLAPLAIAFFFAQRYFVQGIATTGIK